MSTSTGGRAESQTAAALAARRTSAQAALQRVHDALARMRREKTPITVASVGRGRVSRARSSTAIPRLGPRWPTPQRPAASGKRPT
jgi:hypothetical protein